eukprot:758963-Hanusia_phi.AAC.3
MRQLKAYGGVGWFFLDIVLYADGRTILAGGNRGVGQSIIYRDHPWFHHGTSRGPTSEWRTLNQGSRTGLSLFTLGV